MFWWDWHKPAKQYPAWVVAESSVYDYGIAYPDYGFGPDRPWGLIFLSKNNFDADCGWFSSLKEAYLDSRLIEEIAERKNSNQKKASGTQPSDLSTSS